MKNNIDVSEINNRKIIIEIRFQHKPILLDKRGMIIEEIKNTPSFSNMHWGIGDSGIKIFDNDIETESRNVFFLEVDRLLFVSNKIDSIENYYNKFMKFYEIAKSNLGVINAKRIGCRIQGTYKTKTNDFQKVFDGFKSNFPSSIFINEYPAKDMRFILEYGNGRYEIGPIKKDDTFITSNFANSDRSYAEGVGIDTDNYIICSGPITDKQVKDVYVASLAVEKSLYTNMREL